MDCEPDASSADVDPAAFLLYSSSSPMVPRPPSPYEMCRIVYDGSIEQELTYDMTTSPEGEPPVAEHEAAQQPRIPLSPIIVYDEGMEEWVDERRAPNSPTGVSAENLGRWW